MSFKQSIKRPVKKVLRQAIAVRHRLGVRPAKQVMWISHHVPKTAGTSFRRALDSAFGHPNVCKAYHISNYAPRLSAGKAVWVPPWTKVIHGHFSPHQNHNRQFPSAQRIVWIRDPVSRVVSLLNFIDGRTMRSEHFEDFKRSFPRNQVPFEERLDQFLKTTELEGQTRIYKQYLYSFGKEDFAFVGRTEHYEEDILKLHDLMGVELPALHVNAASKRSPSAIDRAYFQNVLSEEYEIISLFL